MGVIYVPTVVVSSSFIYERSMALVYFLMAFCYMITYIVLNKGHCNTAQKKKCRTVVGLQRLLLLPNESVLRCHNRSYQRKKT